MNNEQHIPFDLEWAKRGGITKTKESSSSKSYLCRFVRSDGRTCLIATVRMKHSSDGNFTAHPTEKLIEWTYKDVVMATREECEAAGIEYIDRPNTSAKNTDPYTPANAVPPKTDTERLEHCHLTHCPMKAIRAFIDENKHLADGDNCTLAGLKQVIGGDDD